MHRPLVTDRANTVPSSLLTRRELMDVWLKVKLEDDPFEHEKSIDMFIDCSDTDILRAECRCSIDG
jgi:hypothetical protein